MTQTYANVRPRRSTRSQEEARPWLDHVNCDQATRAALMETRYAMLAEMDEARRSEELRSIIESELGCDDQEYRRLTAARLRAWVQLARQDPDAVRRIGVTYDTIFARLPGASEFRRAMAVQSVASDTLSDGAVRMLIQLVPGVSRFLQPDAVRLRVGPSVDDSPIDRTPKEAVLHLLQAVEDGRRELGD